MVIDTTLPFSHVCLIICEGGYHGVDAASRTKFSESFGTAGCLNSTSITVPRQPRQPISQDRCTRLRGISDICHGGVPLIEQLSALGTLPSLGVVSAALRRYRHLTLEFHAADLLSIDEDGLPPQLSVQPDLRVSWAQKFEVFAAVLGRLAAGAEVRRLDHMVGDVR